MSFIYFNSKQKIFNTNSSALNNALDLYTKIIEDPNNKNIDKRREEFHIWNNMSNELEHLYKFYDELSLQIKRVLVLRFISLNYNIYIFNNIKNNQNQIFFNEILNEKNKLVEILLFKKKVFFKLF